MIKQEIRFATSADGVRIAWAKHGTGPPLLRVGTWLTHLEHDWESPVWRHWLEALGARFTVVRYDERGCGLSDRSPAELGLDRWVKDLEAVAQAAGLERFTLLGMSQGGAIAVAFAAKHPDNVSRLVLYGAYGRGQLRRDSSPQARESVELAQNVIRLGWSRPDPVFRRIFTSRFIPVATEEQMRWFDELERRSTSPETAARLSLARAEVDATELAPQVRCPSLVVHADHDEAVPFAEGRALAALIPGARLVPLPGRNHILLADEPAWPAFLASLDDFTGVKPVSQLPHQAVTHAPLSDRELEVLRLAAAGCSNEEIAARLFLSVRTAERHLSHIYTKLGLSGRSARAAAAARLPELGVGG